MKRTINHIKESVLSWLGKNQPEDLADKFFNEVTIMLKTIHKASRIIYKSLYFYIRLHVFDRETLKFIKSLEENNYIEVF